MNLFDWGIEGEDYVVADGVANFPADNPEGEGLFHSMDSLFGNTFLALPWGDAPADIRTQAQENMKQASLSEYLGFTVDTAGMENTIAAMQSVYGEWRAQLLSGLYNEQMFADYVSAMEAAGMDDYIAEVQAQLDAFLAAR